MRKPDQKKGSRYLAVYLQKRQAQAKDGELPSLEELERDYMNYVLEITNNDPVATAEILDVSTAQMFHRMKKIDFWICPPLTTQPPEISESTIVPKFLLFSDPALIILSGGNCA